MIFLNFTAIVCRTAPLIRGQKNKKPPKIKSKKILLLNDPNTKHEKNKKQSLITRRKIINSTITSSICSLVLNSIEKNEAKANVIQQIEKRCVNVMNEEPSDLFFPKEFEGNWNVFSTLIEASLPLGREMVPDIDVFDRAILEKGITMQYSFRFLKNTNGKVVADRRYNTASLMRTHFDPNIVYEERISWDLDNPDILILTLPGGTSIFTQVVKRSITRYNDNRLDTSENFKQVFENHYKGLIPKIKETQCYTQYTWRSDYVTHGPSIVATQLVSEYLNQDGLKLPKAKGKPVTIYTYKMEFFRVVKKDANILLNHK